MENKHAFTSSEWKQKGLNCSSGYQLRRDDLKKHLLWGFSSNPSHLLTSYGHSEPFFQVTSSQGFEFDCFILSRALNNWEPSLGEAGCTGEQRSPSQDPSPLMVMMGSVRPNSNQYLKDPRKPNLLLSRKRWKHIRWSLEMHLCQVLNENCPNTTNISHVQLWLQTSSLAWINF